jgi:hypothetical protein
LDYADFPGRDQLPHFVDLSSRAEKYARAAVEYGNGACEGDEGALDFDRRER